MLVYARTAASRAFCPSHGDRAACALRHNKIYNHLDETKQQTHTCARNTLHLCAEGQVSYLGSQMSVVLGPDDT
jgi:hypothetical protein